MIPVVVVAGGFLLAVPWLRDQSDAVAMIAAAAAALFVMGWSLRFAVRTERCRDEVQRAEARFAVYWGFSVGAVLAVLLSMLPPFRDLVVGLSNELGTGSPDASDDESVTHAFMLGIMTLALCQTLGTFVAGAAWRISKR
jgi:hypothetical protein